MIDRTRLALIGQALYGEEWVTPMARDLGVARNTVQRWKRGLRTPEDGVWKDLARLAKAMLRGLPERAGQRREAIQEALERF